MSNAVTALTLLLVASMAIVVPAAAHVQAPATSPAQAADDLLATDRAFAAAAARTDTISGLSAMFSDDIVMPLPGGAFAQGREAAVAALRVNPANATSRTEWTPIRVGVSADGRHGFSFGYMATRAGDDGARPGKYLAYWVRTAQGWRVVAYKRAPRPAGEVSTVMLAPSLPGQANVVSAGADRDGQSLRAAEQAFSDTAQEIGIGPAFVRNGTADAMNMGGGPEFLIGADAIAAGVAAPGGTGSPVRWSSDGVLVAASGDLGVSWGVIRANAPPPEGQPAASAFFTIWRRGDDGRWRYIAE